jgi:hypothetical protein
MPIPRSVNFTFITTKILLLCVHVLHEDVVVEGARGSVVVKAL